jgi:hypothetical protein
MPAIESKAMMKIETDLLALAGEYRVCSELNRRGVFATVTYGNHKSVDVYAISDRRERALKIEVKTSQGAQFVTRITQKGLSQDPAAPDFWVLVQMRRTGQDTFVDRFFVLAHAEICEIQVARNAAYAERYRTTHGHDPDFATGVDNVRVEDVEAYEDQWHKIVASFESSKAENRATRHNKRLHPTAGGAGAPQPRVNRSR